MITKVSLTDKFSAGTTPWTPPGHKQWGVNSSAFSFSETLLQAYNFHAITSVPLQFGLASARWKCAFRDAELPLAVTVSVLRWTSDLSGGLGDVVARPLRSWSMISGSDNESYTSIQAGPPSTQPGPSHHYCGTAARYYCHS